MIIVTLTDWIDRNGFLLYSIEQDGSEQEGGDYCED